jgi:signal transduction histidine kinase
MSLRAVFTLLLVFAFAILAGLVTASAYFLHAQFTLLLPPEEVARLDSSLGAVLAVQAAGGFVCVFLVLVLIYVALGRLVVSPLRKLLIAVDRVGESDTPPEFPPLAGSPSEIRALRNGLAAFAGRVDAGHRRDVEMSRVKSDFISTAAHQLRTPLTGMRWALEALDKSELSEDQKSLVANATEKSRELGSVVGTLLDISSIESGKYQYRFAPVDLGGVAGEVTRDFARLARERKVTLYEEGNPSVPPVRADRERIKWVLNNLVENAIRYTPEGGSIRVTLESTPGRVLLHVEDTGIGIEASDRNNIFERFYRAPNAVVKEASGGNGLGLYIARTIATDHGGDLDFKANKGGPGTTFTLSLPTA